MVALSAVISLKDEPLRTAREESGLCADLLARVATIRHDLEASTAESEALQHLSPASLALLKRHDLLNMRLMEDVGGLEASIATQCKVLAALAEADSATAWCSMVHNNGVGTLAAYFPDAAIGDIFRDEIPVVSFVAGANGAAHAVDGGFRVTGTWRFCSGFHNADWIVCATRRDGDPKQELLIVVPKADVAPLDTWNVLGLRGTGSIDFSLTDRFVPASRAIANGSRMQRRGSRLYGRPGILIAVYEHGAFAWGLGRRALRQLTDQAARLGPQLVSRELVAAEVGRLSIQLEAAAGLMLQYYSTLETLSAEESADPVVAAHGRAIAVHVTDVAAACAEAAFRRAGTRAAFLPNTIEMTLRDMKVAQAHILVNDGGYALYGTALTAANPAQA